ncbi:hypothetical protein G9A89_020924 [Geosiphon pyriformis]|nr:hypothetical protein G9A89_020924 [Geosiphon pyriformis]
MAYAPITKLDKFNGKKDDTQVWLNDIAKAITVNNWNDARAIQVIPYFLQDTTDAWYQSLAVKSQNFNGFKTEFLQYFNNNNSINKLANTFTTIRQEDTEAVTIYLECFYRNLRQIQAIQANYFTHPTTSTSNASITYAKDFRTAELEANYAQAVNLAMNRSSELDFKLKQFSDSINQKLEEYLANNRIIYQLSQWHNNQGNANCFQNQSHPSSLSNQSWQPEIHVCHNCVPDSEPSTKSRPIPTHLPAYDAPTNLSTASLSTTATNNLSGTVTSNILTAATSNLSNTHHSNTTSKPSSNDIREPKIEDHPKLEIGDSCTLTNPQLFPPTIRISSAEFGYRNQEIEQQQPPTNNILSATITKNEFLDAIFPFKFEEPLDMPLFSRAALEEKLMTAMYTDAKIDGHSIKLILNIDHTANARIITMDGATKTPIGEINDFPIEVNSIVVLIKVLVIEATQYQALVGNDWLFKTNAMLD